MNTVSGNETSLMASRGAALEWQKSSWSANNGNCVEVARLSDGRVAVRDSKDAHGPALDFAPHAWRAFLGAVKARQFDV